MLQQLILYDLRWILLAIPGAYVLDLTISYMRHRYPRMRQKERMYKAMLISQGILGLLVFWVDRWIFR